MMKLLKIIGTVVAAVGFIVSNLYPSYRWLGGIIFGIGVILVSLGDVPWLK